MAMVSPKTAKQYRPFTAKITVFPADDTVVVGSDEMAHFVGARCSDLFSIDNDVSSCCDDVDSFLFIGRSSNRGFAGVKRGVGAPLPF